MITLTLTDAEAEQIRIAFPGEIADRIGEQIGKQPKSIAPAKKAALFKRIADKHGLPVSDISGPRRLANIVAMRDEVAWELRLLGLSLTSIGAALNRDHTTIVDALRREEKRRK